MKIKKIQAVEMNLREELNNRIQDLKKKLAHGLYDNPLMISFAVDTLYQSREIIPTIPKLKFKSDWEVRITPPFAGATIRFEVFKNDKKVSVYLDYYNNLGYFKNDNGELKPYWEVYLLHTEDVDPQRFALEDSEVMLEEIEKLLLDRV